MVHRIFLWVAVAKVFLSLDKISEAVSIKIGQMESNAGRRFNRKANMVSWCGNLLHLNEEDETVQFAHRTIFDFLTGQPSDTRLEQFHIKVKEADHCAGELCVTYLCWPDFRTALVRKSNLTHETPIIPPTIVGHGKIRERIVGRLVRPQPSPRSIPQPFTVDNVAKYGRENDDGRRDTTQAANPFLQYAHEHWIFHTARFHPGVSKTWDTLKNLILDEDHGTGGSHVSWPKEFSKRDPTTKLHWAYANRHEAIFRILLDTGDETVLRAGSELLLRSAMDGVPRMLVAALRPDTAQTTLDRCLVLACGMPRNIRASEPSVPPGTNPGTKKYPSTPRNDEQDSRPSRTRSSLSLAQKRSRAQVFTCAIAAGADVRSFDDSGFSILHTACEFGNDEIVQVLIEANADLELKDWAGRTPLLVACRDGHGEVVRRLLENGAQIEEKDQLGDTGLIIASQAGHKSVVSVLVAFGAFIHAIDYKGHTALVRAMRARQAGTISVLLDFGAFPLEVDDNICADLFTTLGGNGEGMLNDPAADRVERHLHQCLILAALEGHVGTMDWLLRAGAHPDAFFAKSRYITPLDAAFSSGHVDVIIFLLRRGASHTKLGRQTFQRAYNAGRTPLIRRVLKEYGAEVGSESNHSTMKFLGFDPWDFPGLYRSS